MTQTRSKTQTLLLAAMLLAVGPPAITSAADLRIRQRVTLEGAPRSTELVYYWTAGRKIVDREHQRVVIDFDRRTVTTLDKRDRTYRVETFEDLKRQIERMTAFMRRGLRGLSRERREGMGQGGLDPRARFTLRPSGRSERIAGHVARELVVTGGPLTGSIWIGRDVRRPREDREWAPFMENFGGLDVAGSKFASAMARLDGWPLRTDLWTPADVTVHSEVLEVDTEPPGAELLSIPEGYRPSDGTSPTAPSAQGGSM